MKIVRLKRKEREKKSFFKLINNKGMLTQKGGC